MKDEPIEKQPQRAASLRWIPVAMLYLACTASGFTQVFWPHPTVLLGIEFFMATSAIYWVQLDARHRDNPIPGIALMLFLYIWVLFVPGYLIWTRGFRGLGWATLHSIGLYAVTFFSFCTTLLVTVGPKAFLP